MTASGVRSGFSSPQSAIPSSSVPDWFRRGRPSESVASMWKCTSQKGGLTRQPAASIVRPASAAMPRSTAAMRPFSTAMSMPLRPSGRFALRTMRSNVMGDPRGSALALHVGYQQRLRIVGPARDGAQGGDGEEIGKHQEDLARHGGADLGLQAELERIEGPEEQSSEQ